MDGPGINQKIRFGYAKAAAKLGQDFQLYRSIVPLDPIDLTNLVGTIKAVMTISWKWMTANKYGNAIWYAVIDGQDSSEPLSGNIGDYLVGDQIFFIIGKQYQLPMLAAECNSTISIKRPSQHTDAGYVGYIGETAASSEILMTNMPASVLMDREGEQAKTNLPSDTRDPVWKILLPNLGNVILKNGDIITDTINQEFVIMINELTEFGWRITAAQVVTSR